MKRKISWVRGYEERKQQKEKRYRNSFFLGETIERELLDKRQFQTMTIQKHHY